MVSVILVGIYIAVLIYKCYQWMTWRPEKFPRGPPRLPFFGSYLFLLMINYKHIYKAVQFLCRYYKTTILGMYLGPFYVIVANDQQSVKELLNRQEFDGRPDLPLARLREPDFKLKGLFFTETIKWKDQRRFMLRHLRDFGFGRRDKVFEIELQDELSSCIELIRNGPKYKHENYLFKDDAILCPDIFYGALGNSFMKLVCGERVPRSDQAGIFIAGRGASQFSRTGDDFGRLLSILPIVRYIAPNLSGFKQMREASLDICNYIKSVCDREIETYDENNMRHIVDMYIKEMRNSQRQKDENNNFLYDNLVMCFTDLLLPAQTAISHQLTFLFQRMIRYPEIQKRIQNEIDQHVGNGRLPNLDDRIHLDYTEATVREILRHETLVPAALPHVSLESTDFMGYQVPRGTIMMAGIDSFHHSDDSWDDADAFRPERFLNENGKLCLKLDISLPFGAGKRLCVGETFARNQLFVYTAGILQNFTIKKSATVKYNDESKTLTGLIRYVGGDVYVKFDPR